VEYNNNARPIAQQRDLAKLPRALEPLIERDQWAVWRFIQQKPDGAWQKPPFMATQPERHASTTDPNTWSSYGTALATVQAGKADGITYILTADDPFGAIDLDHCRHFKTYSIDYWAQAFLNRAQRTYVEVTPSGCGLRIWGLADSSPLHKKYTLKTNKQEFEKDKVICAELFRRTHKALTVTGFRLNTNPELANIDKLFDWAVIWGERRKAEAAAAEEAARAANAGNGFDSSGCSYSTDEIERFVREGPPDGENRSNIFHTIVGHYLGCGWDQEKIFEHLQQFPDGIGKRYLEEERLHGEIERSARKYGDNELPQPNSSGWTNGGPATAAPEPQPVQPPPPAPPGPLPWEQDPELEEDDLEDQPAEDEADGGDDDELDKDEELDEPPEQSELPWFYAHGSPDPRPTATWLVKHIIPARGHGLLSGPWGSAKTFVVVDLLAAIVTGQPFLGHAIKRQCGVLFIAAEGANQVRLRFDTVWKDKCGNSQERAPFYWYETAPVLLQKGAVEKLIAMARQIEMQSMEDFGLPLGLIAIDTLAACAGYRRGGEENDNAVGQALMNVLGAVAQEIGCCVLGVDHMGQNLEAGTRGATAKESSADFVLACLGHREVSGAVSNRRLAVRKNRAGEQGQEHPFTLRLVEMGRDEDGDAVTCMVVDWTPPGTAAAQGQQPDPWSRPRRQEQRTAVQRLKRVLMTILAEQGVDLPIPPDGPTVRMVDQNLVRKAFYACTPADEGTPERKGHFRRQKFLRALDWAEDEQLIAVTEIKDVTYLRLTRPSGEEDEN
jgi:hypothetical protein